MFEDKKFQKIDPRQLSISSHPLGEGGYGAVFKAVYLTVTIKSNQIYGCISSLVIYHFIANFTSYLNNPGFRGVFFNSYNITDCIYRGWTGGRG